MLNYKTEFQSNNTDLQNILTKVDILPYPINIDEELTTQANLLTQIQTALNGKAIPTSGSGGITLNDIGIFTFSDADDSQFLFVKGMTFGEWLESNMNVPIPIIWSDGTIAVHYFVKVGNAIEIRDTLESDGVYGFWGWLSTDGTEEGKVTLNTIIQEIEYQNYEEAPF